MTALLNCSFARILLLHGLRKTLYLYMFACISAGFGRPVNGVVHPAAALLYAQPSPLLLAQHPRLGQPLRQIFWEDHVPEAMQQKRKLRLLGILQPAVQHENGACDIWGNCKGRREIQKGWYTNRIIAERYARIRSTNAVLRFAYSTRVTNEPWKLAWVQKILQR